jgi:hypothetical protein
MAYLVRSTASHGHGVVNAVLAELLAQVRKANGISFANPKIP